MELEEALARIAELEGQVTALTGERDAVTERSARPGVGARDAGRAAGRGDRGAGCGAAGLSEANGSLAEVQARGLTYLRRALLAEHAGQVVPELVAATTRRRCWRVWRWRSRRTTRALESARATIAGQTVPAGAPSARTSAASAGLSPLEMIESGLREEVGMSADEGGNQMPLLLAESAKLSNDMVQRGVIETIIEESPMLGVLPFLEVEGNSFKYNQENTLGGAASTR